jgi:protein TonB
MSQYLETLDQPESLGKHWLASVAVHAGMVGLAFLGGITVSNKPNDWGSPNVGGGGSVSITPVKTIPLPSRPGLVNPLANDSNTTVPLPPPKPKVEPKAVEPEPDAIPIKGKKAEKNKKKREEPVSPKTTYRAPGRDEPNQLTSDVGPALKSPLIGQAGPGGIGVGQGSTLGTRFGWYIDLLRNKVGQHWNPDQQSPNPAVVTFTLMKDGSVRDLKLNQRSGSTILDFACQRAILDATPFPNLPDGAGNSVNIEFWFNVRR